MRRKISQPSKGKVAVWSDDLEMKTMLLELALSEYVRFQNLKSSTSIVVNFNSDLFIVKLNELPFLNNDQVVTVLDHSFVQLLRPFNLTAGEPWSYLSGSQPNNHVCPHNTFTCTDGRDSSVGETLA